MEQFDLKCCLDDVYKQYPEAERKPVIGITANYADGEARLSERYYKAVAAAGGVPVIIPPLAGKDEIINTLDRIDGLLLTGGGDVNPLWVGEEPSPRLHSINRERDKAELMTVRLAYNRQMPILGICRGIQVLAAALGGEVEQDIDEGFSTGRLKPADGEEGRHALLKHSQDADRSEPTHTVEITKYSTLYALYYKERMAVNSMHHQAVRSCGRRFTVSATAPDGVIEAIESAEFKPVMGVQWHPEWLGDDGQPLFKWLVGEAQTFINAKKIHRRTLILDTHCDTPMFFPQGIHFDRHALRHADVLPPRHSFRPARPAHTR